MRLSTVLLIALVMTSCGDRDDGYNGFYVSGEFWECKGYAKESCGVSLWDCKGGNEGECLTDVE